MIGAVRGPGTTYLIDEPHHDGSARYVSTQAPALGDTVTVWLRVPEPAVEGERVRAVHVRTHPDGEARFADAAIDRVDGRDTWWRAQVRVANPVTGYRFLLEGGPGGYQWLNGTGLHDRDVPDAADFRLVAVDAPAPEWMSGAVVYQIFPDRFARSAAADDRPAPDWAIPASWDDEVLPYGAGVGQQLYGGDLDGIAEHLDHIVDLGATAIYLTPVFPGRSNHRYDADTFDRVDPLLGGDEALIRLVQAAHARGLRVIGDITLNHTGAGHDWFRAAQADAAAPERDFYFIADDGSYESWFGVPSLPKLDYRSAELSRRIFDDPTGVARRWLTPPYDLDGWRVDVANMTGRLGADDANAAVARSMRSAVADARPDALLVGEHCHDFTSDIVGDGWQGSMNYAGFLRPVWTWLRHPEQAPPRFLGAPLVVPRLGGPAVVDTIREFSALMSWTVLTHSFTLLGSHDTSRVRTLLGGEPGQARAALGLLATMPGVPMVTYGDEIGMTGTTGEYGRKPMPWDDFDWDSGLLADYRTLLTARRDHVALAAGGLRWIAVGDDVIVYLREHPQQTAVVVVARGDHEPPYVRVRDLPGVEGARTIIGAAPVLDDAGVLLGDGRAGAHVWVWES